MSDSRNPECIRCAPTALQPGATLECRREIQIIRRDRFRGDGGLRADGTDRAERPALDLFALAEPDLIDRWMKSSGRAALLVIVFRVTRSSASS